MAKARPIDGLDGAVTFADAARMVVAVRIGELVDHSENVLDTEDIERVHDMRVATRRLRAALEVFAPAFPAKAHRAVLRDVKALADALGARRDPDVHLEQLETLRGVLPEADHGGLDVLVDRLREDQTAGNAELAVALQQARDCELEARLRALVGEPA